MRNRRNFVLVAVALFASKSSAPQDSPGGLAARIDLASRLVNGSLGNVLCPSLSPTSSAPRVRSADPFKAPDASVAAELCPTVPLPRNADPSRGSDLSNTGSAITAASFGAGLRLAVSSLSVASADAEGRLTIA